MKGERGRLILPCLVAILAAVTLAGQAPQPQAKPDIPAERGTLSISAEAAAAMVAGVKAPAGFTVLPFAGPPIANYPACLTATEDDVLFVCVDRNGSLGAQDGMGYVLRLVDRDRDGRADEYSVFATMDSPRGAVFDGDALYVSHPPFVTALRDRDGDGVAEDKRTLVRGLGFGLDFRGADHTTNGIEMGIDGWLYVAVGDYGAVKAVGTDGREIQMRGGGNVRVRPDGTGLEIYSRGTRNDYDVAIDPYMNLFARGNTNDGGGFDIRLYHFVEGATFGYPSLFRNFANEVVPPIADYGTGSGTGMLYVDDSGLPAPFGASLYSIDWGRNAIYRHPLTPKGATFAPGQEPFVTVTRPNDMAIDGSSRLYVASWTGGQFNYAGPDVGFIVQLRHASEKPAPRVNFAAATDAALVDAVVSGSQVHRRFAQHALLRRGATAERIALVERRMTNAASLQGRVAALYTLKQLAGESATPALVKAAADPSMRAIALRALADRKDQLTGVPTSLFVQALADPDPRVQLQAITGLKRLGATEAARAMVPLTVSSDPVVANVAVNALVAMRSIDALLPALTAANATSSPGALRALQQLHEPRVVSGLIESLSEVKVAERRADILQALARLHYREGVWRGTLQEWWGTRPDTTGPYYDATQWEESGRIAAVLKTELRQAAAAASATPIARFVTDLQRNRVIPPGASELLSAMAMSRHASLAETSDLLIGRIRLDVDTSTAARLEAIGKLGPSYRESVLRMVAMAGVPSAAAGEMLRLAAMDRNLPVALRVSALTTLATGTGPDALSRSIDAFGAAYRNGTIEEPLDASWRAFVNAPGHATNVAAFRSAATSSDEGKQVMGYAVLAQLAAEPAAGRGRAGGGGGGRGRGGAQAAAIEAARAEARSIIDAAWTSPSAASLVRAVGLTNATMYRDTVLGLQTSTNTSVRDAAMFATGRLAAAANVAAAVPGPGGRSTGAADASPVVSTVPFGDLVGRLGAVTGVAAEGRALFERQGCAACHTTTAGEPEKGPYLGGIAQRYSRAELVESILRPSAKVAQGFATNQITTNDNRQLSGFVVREGPAEIVMRDLAGVETTIQKSAIRTRTVGEGSVMPAGLADGLTLQELASLLAFLESTSPK